MLTNANTLCQANAAQRPSHENPGQQCANNAADGVYTENIQRIVITQSIFQLGCGQVAKHASSDTDSQGSHGADRPAGRGDGDQACDCATGNAQHAGLAVEQPFTEHPTKGSGRCSNLGNSHGHAGGAVRCQFAACIEAEPANPEHGCANNRITEVVRQHRGFRIPVTLAQHDAGHETGNARIDMHHRTTGKIQYPHFAKPAATPYPMTNWRIDEY